MFIYCLTTYRPAPKIIWKKNGVQLKSAGAIELPIAFYNRLLNITNVQKGLHEDKYACEAEVNGIVNLRHDFSLKVEGKDHVTSRNCSLNFCSPKYLNLPRVALSTEIAVFFVCLCVTAVIINARWLITT